MSGRERVEAVLERLVEASATERILISAASLLLAIAVGTVIILVSGFAATCETAAYTLAGPGFSVGSCFDPVEVFDRLFLGALGDPLQPGWDPLDGQIAVTLRETTVLIFTGLSFAIAFRAGIFNIGTQGQMVVGALATGLGVLWAAPVITGLAGTVVLIPFGLLVGAIFGGLYGLIPGLLKAYADANEVITTIMLNFVATGVTLYLVSEVFKDPNSPANQTIPLPEYALFPPVVFQPRDDFSLFALAIGVVVIVALYVLIEGTTFGYDVRTSGLQPEAAEYGGVDAARTIVTSLTLSGALGGVAGAIYVLMIIGKYQTGVPAWGFDGITVSILAGNNPLGIGFAAFLFGILKSGSTVVQFATDVPPQLVGVLRGLIVLFVAMPEFFRLIGKRIQTVERRGREAIATDGGEPNAVRRTASDERSESEAGEPSGSRRTSSEERSESEAGEPRETRRGSSDGGEPDE